MTPPVAVANPLREGLRVGGASEPARFLGDDDAWASLAHQCSAGGGVDNRPALLLGKVLHIKVHELRNTSLTVLNWTNTVTASHKCNKCN